MSEQTFEQMLNESFKTIHTGEAVEGSVIDVKPDEAILNIGCKSDGVLSRSEYTNDSSVDLTEVLKIGDKLEVKVLKTNDGEGQVVLSYKRLAADRGNKRIEEAYNNREVLKAKVTQVLSGGLSVVVEEVRVFIPASLVSDTYERDLNKYLDQEIEFVISKNAEIIPIEVKSKNGRTESLNSFIKKYNPKIVYKFIDGNTGKTDNKVTLPHFMAMYL